MRRSPPSPHRRRSQPLPLSSSHPISLPEAPNRAAGQAAARSTTAAAVRPDPRRRDAAEVLDGGHVSLVTRAPGEEEAMATAAVLGRPRGSSAPTLSRPGGGAGDANLRPQQAPGGQQVSFLGPTQTQGQ